MKIKLKLFSSLMEYLPANAVGNTVTIEGVNISCNAIIKRHNIQEEAVQIVMLNGEYFPKEKHDDKLTDGDTLSVWPAIQGG